MPSQSGNCYAAQQNIGTTEQLCNKQEGEDPLDQADLQYEEKRDKEVFRLKGLHKVTEVLIPPMPSSCVRTRKRTPVLSLPMITPIQLLTWLVMKVLKKSQVHSNVLNFAPFVFNFQLSSISISGF